MWVGCVMRERLCRSQAGGEHSWGAGTSTGGAQVRCWGASSVWVHRLCGSSPVFTEERQGAAFWTLPSRLRPHGLTPRPFHIYIHSL